MKLKEEKGTEAAQKYMEAFNARDSIASESRLSDEIQDQGVEDVSKFRRPSYLSTLNFPDEEDFDRSQASLKMKMLFTLIKSQLLDEKHPIKIVTEQFQDLICESYLKYVNRRAHSSSELWGELDRLNKQFLENMQNKEERMESEEDDGSEQEWDPSDPRNKYKFAMTA